MTLVIAVLGVAAVLLIGGLLTRLGPWYEGLRKPRWQPPGWLFGPVWTVIGALTAWSAALAWNAAAPAEQEVRVAMLFAANAVLNMAWSGLFFTMRRPDWALGEVVLLWFSVLALIVGIMPLSTPAAWLLVPYLAWVAFAAVLNLAIVRLNAPFLTIGGHA